MPIYEFHCKECRREFKTLRPASQIADVACPECGTNRVARLLSVTARTSENGAPEPMAMGGCCQGAQQSCACRFGN